MDSTANLAPDYLLVSARIAAAIVAAGVDRASATPILATWARVICVPAGSGVKLPPAVAGLERTTSFRARSCPRIRIDAAIALIMAVGQQIVREAEQTGRIIYKDTGLLLW